MSNTSQNVTTSGTVRTPYGNTSVQSSNRNFDLAIYDGNNTRYPGEECGITQLGLNQASNDAGDTVFSYTFNSTETVYGRPARYVRLIGSGDIGTWAQDERIRVRIRISYFTRY
jgi:Flp pilus assembly protein TadG